MQPRSIKLFTILFFLANAVAIAGDYVFYDRFTSEALIETDAEIPANWEEYVAALTLGFYAVTYGAMLLVWFLIVERRSKIAKWVLVAFATFFVVAPLILTASFKIDEMIVYGMANLLEISAVAMLFRVDARKWFDRIEDIDPEVFS